MTYHKDGYVPTGKKDYGTPLNLFATLNAEFRFDLDAAADDQNALCGRYFTQADDGLRCEWDAKRAVWCNPPYGRGVTEAWLDKGFRESESRYVPVVMLVPAAVGSKWFRPLVVERASEVRFVSGRLKFRGQPKNALFDSCLVIYNPYARNRGNWPTVRWVDTTGRLLLPGERKAA